MSQKIKLCSLHFILWQLLYKHLILVYVLVNKIIYNVIVIVCYTHWAILDLRLFSRSELLLVSNPLR